MMLGLRLPKGLELELGLARLSLRLGPPMELVLVLVLALAPALVAVAALRPPAGAPVLELGSELGLVSGLAQEARRPRRFRFPWALALGAAVRTMGVVGVLALGRRSCRGRHDRRGARRADLRLALRSPRLARRRFFGRSFLELVLPTWRRSSRSRLPLLRSCCFAEGSCRRCGLLIRLCPARTSGPMPPSRT